MARFSFRFLRRRRAHPTDLAAATAAEDTERAKAVQRILDLAHANLAQTGQRPAWNAPTAAYRPLMTRGQAVRGHGGRQ